MIFEILLSQYEFLHICRLFNFKIFLNRVKSISLSTPSLLPFCLSHLSFSGNITWFKTISWLLFYPTKKNIKHFLFFLMFCKPSLINHISCYIFRFLFYLNPFFLYKDNLWMKHYSMHLIMKLLTWITHESQANETWIKKTQLSVNIKEYFSLKLSSLFQCKFYRWLEDWSIISFKQTIFHRILHLFI